MHGLHTITVPAAAAVARTQAWADATLKHRPIGLPHSTDTRAIVSHIGNLATVTAALVQAATSGAMQLDGFTPATEPAPPPAGFVAVTSELFQLYRDLAVAALHAATGGHVLSRGNDVQGVAIPTQAFDLLVLIAGKVEAVEGSEMFPEMDDVEARHPAAAAGREG